MTVTTTRLSILRTVGISTLALAAFTAVTSAAQAAANVDARGRSFVERHRRAFRVDGREFRVAGTNNYYLMYKSRTMVDAVLTAASASGFNVVRTWGFLDIGNQDGTNSIRGKAEGVYFQYWNGTAPAYNDGASGLERLDYVIARAGQLGLRLIIPLTNNWNDFGGMDQYVRWRGGQFHDEFYTDATIRGWYKDWISHVLSRVNTLTGIAYKDDATVMAWELGNEPRCRAYGVYPESGQCDTQTLVAWADDVSRHVKSVDTRHLLGMGDEGFFCVPGSTDWTENCGEGIDTLALANLPMIDVATYHLYPDSWGKDAAWGTEWIKRHIRENRKNRERALLGEFGLKDRAVRNPVYKKWTDTVFLGGGPGAMYWILSDKQDDGSLYPDYDGFTVYCPSPVCTTLSHFADMNLLRGPYSFPPVADHDAAETPFDTPVTLHPTANDVTYWSVPLAVGKLDLDPATQGQQTEYESPAGSFALLPGGDVSFSPASGFSGKAVASYVVPDALRRLSNVAELAVTVKPDPDAALKLYSFETGTEGWAPGSWQPTAGTVAQSGDFASDGAYSLRVDAADGGWFGVTLAPTPGNLSPKTRLKYDLMTGSAGTSTNVALQLTDNWTWCQGAWGYANSGTTSTVEIDLQALDCGLTDVTKLQALWVFFSGGGTFHIDNVRAE